MDGKEFETPLKYLEATGPFLQALHAPLNEPLTRLFEDQGAAEGADSLFAQVAAGVYPREALTADLVARTPYGNPEQIKEALKESAGRGWINLSDTGFTATEKALTLTKGIIAMLTNHCAGLEAGITGIPRMVELLGRLVEGAEKADFKIKPTFTFARNYEYEDKTPSLLWVRRHILTLASFRDDCHMDAWQSQYDLPGYVFEAFTFIWQGDANTAAALAEALPFRNYTEEEYAGALEKLVGLGWIELAGDGFALTEIGKKHRDEVETRTNRNYQAAFAVLSDDEFTELIGLIKKLTAAIAPPETEEQA
ncbi:MAG: helix-turn-helix domain-containing protein [Anaerolineales bacterium]